MDDAPTTTRHTNHHHPMRAARTGKACDVPPSDIQLTHRLVCSRSLLYPLTYGPGMRSVPLVATKAALLPRVRCLTSPEPVPC